MELTVQEATHYFETLLRQQLRRVEQIENQEMPASLHEVNPLIIGVCPGDGIGPIIMTETMRVIKVLLADELAAGTVVLREIEGLTLENRLACGDTIPADVLSDIKKCHVLLKGPTTTPQAGTGVPNLESANVALRRELDFMPMSGLCIPKNK